MQPTPGHCPSKLPGWCWRTQFCQGASWQRINVTLIYPQVLSAASRKGCSVRLLSSLLAKGRIWGLDTSYVDLRGWTHHIYQCWLCLMATGLPSISEGGSHSQSKPHPSEWLEPYCAHTGEENVADSDCFHPLGNNMQSKIIRNYFEKIKTNQPTKTPQEPKIQNGMWRRKGK